MGTPRHTLFALLVTSAWAFSAHGEHARGALGSVEASPEPAQSAQAAAPSPLGDLQPRLILPTPGSIRGAAGDAATATASATTAKPVSAAATIPGTPSKPGPQGAQAAAGGATSGALVGPLSNIAVIDSQGGGAITNSSDAALGLGAVDPRNVMKVKVSVEVGTLNLGSLATPPLTTMPAVGNVQYGPSGGGGGGGK